MGLDVIITKTLKNVFIKIVQKPYRKKPCHTHTGHKILHKLIVDKYSIKSIHSEHQRINKRKKEKIILKIILKRTILL